MEGSDPLADTQRPVLREVLESAARLQAVVPDAVLVEGSAAALYGDHRDSYDHDHVLADLAERFEAVLEAVERTDGWVTNRVTPGRSSSVSWVESRPASDNCFAAGRWR